MIRLCKPDGTPTNMVLWPQNIKDVPEEELNKLIDECIKELARRKRQENDHTRNV